METKKPPDSLHRHPLLPSGFLGLSPTVLPDPRFPGAFPAPTPTLKVRCPVLGAPIIISFVILVTLNCNHLSIVCKLLAQGRDPYSPPPSSPRPPGPSTGLGVQQAVSSVLLGLNRTCFLCPESVLLSKSEEYPFVGQRISEWRQFRDWSKTNT